MSGNKKSSKKNDFTSKLRAALPIILVVIAVILFFALRDKIDWDSLLDSGTGTAEPGLSVVTGEKTDHTPDSSASPSATDSPEKKPDVNGTNYTTKEDIALYLHVYGKLPSNFITKDQASALGWSGGGLDKYQNGACIGGDVFRNSEKLLPVKKGRTWYECDVETLHAKERGAKRIVYSDDGLIYYTEDHYATFTQLY